MGNWTDPQYLLSWLRLAWKWVRTELLVPASLFQLLTIVAVFGVTWLIGGPLRRWLNGLADRIEWIDKPPGLFLKASIKLIPAILALALMATIDTLAEGAGWTHHLVTSAVSLLSAWVVIKLSSSVVRNATWSRVIFWTAMAVAALNIFELLDPAVALLDDLDITLGKVRISVLGVFKGVAVLVVLFKLAALSAALVDRRLKNLPGLTPSIQVLLAKVIKVALFVVAFMMALSSVGIDLTHFAFFSGAVGLGLGFGLQKVISNLVSGVILLLDKSIKPGDVITVGQSFGRITTMSARYVSVVTRDGTEYLIPNEDLITNQVVNWSYSNTLVRVKIGVGVAYSSDVALARELCLQAAKEIPRVISQPAPVCHLIEFGESSVDLQLRIWISDPQNGTTNVASAVRLKIWDLFHENDIEIPFPQRDIHVKAEAAVEPIGVETPDRPRD